MSIQSPGLVMTSHMTILLLLTSMTFDLQTAHSALTFTSRPHDIQPLVTETLDMMCSVKDDLDPSVTPTTSTTPAVNGGVVGRRRRNSNLDTSETSNQQGMISKRSSSSSSSSSTDPIRHIASLTISRDGVPVAAISTYTPAVVESDVDKGNLQVTGDTGYLGYLHLIWSFPTAQQLGNYTCSVTAITALGHPVTLTESLTLTKAHLNLFDILRELQDLKKFANDQNMTNIVQKKENEFLKSTNAAYKTELETLKGNVAQLQSSIQTLRNDVDEAMHTETGLLYCGDANGNTWTHKGTDYQYQGRNFYWNQRQMSATFTRKYKSPPVVFLDVAHMWLGVDDSVRYGSQLLTVDTHGFTMRCGSHDADMQGMEVRWISVAAD